MAYVPVRVREGRWDALKARLDSKENVMFKGTLDGKSWQSVGLRNDGSRAILWGREIMWLSAAEFQALLNSEA